MNRYGILKDILNKKRLFKVVCGAGNEDPEEIRKLTKAFTLAKTGMIDISANVEIVEACKKGIAQALEIAPKMGISLSCRPFINVSVGLRGDPHVRKARISGELCVECGQCTEQCEQSAINDSFSVIEYRCIGCGKCAEVCEADAITFYHKKLEFEKILPEVLNAGAENLELHAIIEDDKAVIDDWRLLSDLVPGNFVSMCMDQTLLSNTHLSNRIKEAYAVSGERTIIQADGDPMSGGSDDFNTTLQAVSTADIVQKSGVPVKILASGGTNSRTKELADLCGVNIHGVSIGTFARKLIRREIETEEFDQDTSILAKAVEKASRLVNWSIGEFDK
ncbi:MAG: DUF561 domain-containing protein [Deltaproteobacteria bacterium]|nr:DUF561 domain-containing protein [Deltaproteobacteria bacterium]